MIRAVNSEHIQILDYELLVFIPSYPQALRLLYILGALLQVSSVKQIKDLFIVNLQERARNCNVSFSFLLFSLPKGLSNWSYCNSVIQIFADDGSSSSLIHLCLLILVTLHSIGFTRACLPIGKDGCMKAIQYLPNERLDLKLVEHFLLRVVRIYDLIKFKSLAHLFRWVFAWILIHAKKIMKIHLFELERYAKLFGPQNTACLMKVSADSLEQTYLIWFVIEFASTSYYRCPASISL